MVVYCHNKIVQLWLLTTLVHGPKIRSRWRIPERCCCLDVRSGTTTYEETRSDRKISGLLLWSLIPLSLIALSLSLSHLTLLFLDLSHSLFLLFFSLLTVSGSACITFSPYLLSRTLLLVSPLFLCLFLSLTPSYVALTNSPFTLHSSLVSFTL